MKLMKVNTLDTVASTVAYRAREIAAAAYLSSKINNTLIPLTAERKQFLSANDSSRRS
jgi:hypothetical protein